MAARKPWLGRKPRNSGTPHAPMSDEQKVYWDRIHGKKPLTADDLRDLMARAMCPDEWAEYDAGKGVCSNMAGWKCVDSVRYASRAYRALHAAGVDLPEPPTLDSDLLADANAGYSETQLEELAHSQG